MAASNDAVAKVWDDWRDAVNMAPSELESFLDSDESKSVGDTGGDGESTGHKSGRRIVDILRQNKSDLTDDDAAHMRSARRVRSPAPRPAPVG